MEDLRDGPRKPPPLFWVKKEEKTEGRKASWASKIAGPLLSSGSATDNHCLQFLLGHGDVPREIQNNAYAIFGELKRCIMGLVQVENWSVHTSNWFDRIKSKCSWFLDLLSNSFHLQAVFLLFWNGKAGFSVTMFLSMPLGWKLSEDNHNQ